jgi:formate dehydrogenase maturation protein FdhE
MQAVKTFLRDDILQQAYEHPKYARHSFGSPEQCPQCNSEHVAIIKREQGRKYLWCQFCYCGFWQHENLAA